MDYINIRYTKQSIEVDFGDYFGQSPKVDSIQVSYRQSDLFKIKNRVDHILLYMSNDAMPWKLGLVPDPNDKKLFVIDTINDYAPQDINDLYDKLNDIMSGEGLP